MTFMWRKVSRVAGENFEGECVMKKLLAFLLVLGMASMASAAVSFSAASVDVLDDGTPVAVSIDSDVSGTFLGYVGPMASLIVEAAAGPEAGCS